ncbi:helix-turn-helix domain-containing protein [Geothrix edaphica]|uniref:helix-turn-helix domain-containing protein n=1 Tax=Geothrix edaphica TaxID=2927976 RepID=UPI00255498E7|nr:helix-turn-helix domain-containing protein [Geothrix edaphica]
MAPRQPSRPGTKGSKAGRSKSRINRQLAKRGKYKPRSGPADPKTPGERIRAARRALGLTQRELGEKLRTDQTTVSAWELNKPAKLAGPSLVALAKLLQTSPEAILTGKGWALPSAEPGGEGSDRVAESYADDLVHLPPSRASEGQAIWIPREAPGDFEEMKATLILAKLKKALAEKRPVWVIVGQ